MKRKMNGMEKTDVKNNVKVVDRWYPEKGTGIIKDVKKAVFKVVFGDKVERWDYAHAYFLDKV